MVALGIKMRETGEVRKVIGTTLFVWANPHKNATGSFCGCKCHRRLVVCISPTKIRVKEGDEVEIVGGYMKGLGKEISLYYIETIKKIKKTK